MPVVFKTSPPRPNEGSVWYDEREDRYFILSALTLAPEGKTMYVAISLTNGKAYDYPSVIAQNAISEPNSPFQPIS